MISAELFSRESEPSAAPDIRGWIASLSHETALLRELADVTRRTRQVNITPRGPIDGEAEFTNLLERQTELCRELEILRDKRAALLARSGQRPKDLLVVVLASLPKERHAETISAFKEYVDCAEAAQREVDKSREYFAVALSTVEDVLSSVVAKGTPVTYGANGMREAPTTAFCLSKVT